MVWNSLNLASSWSNGPTFSTQTHQAPATNYTWTPTNPNVNQQTRFTDTSIAFGGTTIQSWTWAFQDGSPSSSTEQNPIVQFNSAGTKATSLIARDSGNISCGAQKTLQTGGAPTVPLWQEIFPFF
jgi:PKD repeat protein